MRPALVEELEEMIGLPATLALVEQWGGISVYVPETMPEGHPVSVQLGHEAAIRLARYAGRSWLRVPRCARMLQERRDREIAIKQRRQRGAVGDAERIAPGKTPRGDLPFGHTERRGERRLRLRDAGRVLLVSGKPALYARVDGVFLDGSFVLLELELVEPSLFLQFSEGAPRVFAQAIRTALHS